jgi:hypothetical protein
MWTIDNIGYFFTIVAYVGLLVHLYKLIKLEYITSELKLIIRDIDIQDIPVIETSVDITKLSDSQLSFYNKMITLGNHMFDMSHFCLYGFVVTVIAIIFSTITLINILTLSSIFRVLGLLVLAYLYYTDRKYYM